jgi:hypothetical protein
VTVAVVEDEAPAAAGPAERRRWRWLLVVALAVPMVVGLAVLAGERWYPAGDMAQAELHLKGFLDDPPLVGAAGRIGTFEDQGSHPGPSMWLALYPVYRLLGASSFGLMVSVTALNVVTLAAIVVVARRHGGDGLVLALAVPLALLVRASGPEFFVEPWNPWVAVLPFLLFLLLVWGAADGDLVLVPFAVGVGIHCVQSHVGYAVLVLGLLGVLALWLAVTTWRDGRQRRRLLTMAAVSVGVAAVLWLPPVVEQLVRDPGNLGILWRHFSNPAEEAVGVATAVKAYLGEMNLLGPWVLGRGPLPGTSVHPVGLAATAALWGGGVVAAARRRDRSELMLHAVLAVSSVLGVVAMSRVFGTFFDYVIRWMWPMAALVASASLWSLGRTVARARSDRAVAPVLLATGLVVTLAVCTVAAVQFGRRAVLPGEPDSRVIGALVPDVAAQLDPDARYLVRWIDPVALGAVGFGSVLELERRGLHAGVDSWARAGALPHRVLPEAEADGVLYVVLGPQIEAWRARADAVELGATDPRTPEEAERSEALRASVEEGLRAAGRDDLADRLDAQYGLGSALFAPGLAPELAAQVAELVSLRLPAAVFLVPPGAPQEASA